MTSDIAPSTVKKLVSKGQRKICVSAPHVGPKRIRNTYASAVEPVLPVANHESAEPVHDSLLPANNEGAFKRSSAQTVRTREEWLQQSVALLNCYVFDHVNYPLPRVEVTVGFPSKKGAAKIVRSLGQCWPQSASANGVNQIFLNPTLENSESFLAVLAHELVHAVDDCQSGHRGAFITISNAIGLTDGKPKNANPGPELAAQIKRILLELGDFPHATLSLAGLGTKPQGTRLLKIGCTSCGYTCRTTAKWIEIGMPTCPCQTVMKPVLDH